MKRSLLLLWDYIVFGLTIAISISIGIYYMVRRKSETPEEYLLGNRKLPWLPVALSMTTSFMSAIIVLGTPSEVYYYGTMYWWTGVTYIIMCLVTITVYIPMFYKLSLTSCYEYLEMRFNRSVRIIGTVSFLLQTILYLGLVTYLPALALSQVTSLSLWGSLLGTGFTCIIYSTLGGIKGIVAADCFQLVVMLVGLLTILIKGIIDANGFASIWNDAVDNGNLVYADFSGDPRVRHTVWSLLIGGTITWVSNYGIGQSQVQRYLSCRSQKDAKIAVIVNCVCLNVILALVMLIGLICSSHFKGCDPLLSKEISRPDQMVPLMVVQKMAVIPGVTGLIISAAFSGTLSTVSTGIHSMSCVVLQDFIKPSYPAATEYNLTVISRFFTLAFGLLSILLAFAASKLSFILQAALSVWGVVGGPLVGVFTLGLFFPFTNSHGAIAGQISGFIVTAWIAFGAQLYKQYNFYTKRLDTTVVDCIFNHTNSTHYYSSTSFNLTANDITEAKDLPLQIYNLSYLYYSLIAVSVTIVVGIAVSCATGIQTTSPDLIFPAARYLQKKSYAKTSTKNFVQKEAVPLKPWSSKDSI